MQSNNETQVLESFQTIPLDEFATKELIIEKTDEEIANDILNKRISLEDIARTPDWKKEVFFSKWEDANPGLRPFQLGEKPRSERERQLIEQKEELNAFLASTKSPWRANCYHYRDKESSIMLRSKISQRHQDQGLYMYQEISEIFKFHTEIPGEENRKGYGWNANSFNFYSEKTGEFVKLDKLINTGKSSSAKRKVYEAENAKFSQVEASNDSIFVPNIKDINGIFTLLHELGHAQMYTIDTDREFQVKRKAKLLFKKTFKEKIEYEKTRKPGELSLETAYKITVDDERRAWLFGLKIFKEIDENTKIGFGGPEDRKKLQKYAESKLRTYDKRFLPLHKLDSNRIPAFSQEQRGAARILEDKIKKGEIKREEAFGKSFDPKTRQYKGANIQSIYQ